MSKPHPGLVERAHLIPHLQMDIESGAGMRPNELCDALAAPLQTKGVSLLRKWFHWRQTTGQQIPRAQELRTLVREAERRGWLAGNISRQGAELLRFLEEDYERRQSLARQRFEDELEPEIKRFSVKMFEILEKWDSTSRSNEVRKKHGINLKASKKGGAAKGTRYEMAKPVVEEPATEVSFGLLNSIPVAFKDISQAMVDLIKERWPDYAVRPRELSPENLRRIAEFAGLPFLTFADEVAVEAENFRKTGVAETEELLEYQRAVVAALAEEELEYQRAVAAAIAEGGPAEVEYRLGDAWKTDGSGNPK